MPNREYPSQFRSEETQRELLSEQVDSLKKRLDKMDEDRDKTLTWGIRTLITVVGALVLWIANNLGFLGRHAP